MIQKSHFLVVVKENETGLWKGHLSPIMSIVALITAADVGNQPESSYQMKGYVRYDTHVIRVHERYYGKKRCLGFGDHMNKPGRHDAKRKIQKDKYCLISLSCGILKMLHSEAENRIVFGWLGARG